MNGYSKAEEKWHVISHFVGLLFVCFNAHWLLVPEVGDRVRAGVWIFIVTFFAVFFSSSLYHAMPVGKWKRMLQRIDHMAIYFFIAGTNTPYLLLSDHTAAPIFLILMWLMVLIGVVLKLLPKHLLSDRISLFYYLLMGWLGVVTLYLVFHLAFASTLALLCAGGIFYTVGTYFYHHDHRRWYHTVWHVFVLLGATAHFAALYAQL